MNRPTDKIHDVTGSYGRLLVPWFGKSRNGDRVWLAYFPPYGITKTSCYGFHNCRATGIH